MVFKSDCSLLLRTGVQFIVFYIIIKTQVVFKILLVLISLLVNLSLLASLEERSTYKKLDCFLEIVDGDILEKSILADEATRNEFALFWETMAGLEIEAFSCFWK